MNGKNEKNEKNELGKKVTLNGGSLPVNDKGDLTAKQGTYNPPQPLYKMLNGCALEHLTAYLETALPVPNYHLKQIIVKVEENEDLPEGEREQNPGSHWFGYPLLEHDSLFVSNDAAYKDGYEAGKMHSTKI